MSVDGEPSDSATILAYINTQGLPESKYKTLRQQMIDLHWNALVVAETWWIRDSYSWDSWVVGSTTFPSHPRTIGHQNGGMILVVPQPLQHHIFPIHNTEYTITFRYFQYTVMAVYLPPRLDPPTVSSLLSSSPAVDFLVGDFNIHLGKLTRDNHTSEPTRIDAVFQATERLNLSHCPAQLGRAGPHHVFSKSNHPPDWGYHPSPVQSDHGIMLLEIPPLSSPSPSPTPLPPLAPSPRDGGAATMPPTTPHASASRTSPHPRSNTNSAPAILPYVNPWPTP